MDINVLNISCGLICGILGVIMSIELPKLILSVSFLFNMPNSYFLTEILNGESVQGELVSMVIGVLVLSLLITRICTYYSMRVLGIYCPSKCTKKDYQCQTIKNCSKGFGALDLTLRCIIVGICVVWFVIFAGYFAGCLNLFNNIKF
jgi:hypothetical protein